jgi:hypothetical protein
VTCYFVATELNEGLRGRHIVVKTFESVEDEAGSVYVVTSL